MTDKESLVELLEKEVPRPKADYLAIYLIANGAKIERHGEWFLLDECANEGIYCSVCHKKVYRKEYANQKLKSRFCPNCGARMDLSKKMKVF